MLPFPIMNQYGNAAAQKPKIVSVDGGSSRNSFYILYDNGELYGFYDNFYGAFGNGTRNNITDKFTLINSNVKMYGASDTACVVIKNDNTIWHSGSTTAYKNESSVFNLVPTNITSYFSTIAISEIKKILVLNSGIVVMLNNGNVYGIGAGSLGQMGTSAAITTLTLLVSSVKDFFGTQYNSGYITNSNDLYITGYNLNGQLGTGNTTNRSSYALLASNVSTARISVSGTVVKFLDSSVKACGSAGQGGLGVGISSGNVTTLTSISPVLELDFDKVQLYSTTSCFGISSGTLYSTGAQGASLNSSTSKYTYMPTVTPLGIDFDGISVVGGCSYMWKGTDLYYCGGTTTDPNKGTTNVYAFQKVLQSLPYYS